MTAHLLSALPSEALDNYVERYEEGRVQHRPRLRFVDADGRACPAAALAGAETSSEFADREPGAGFLGSRLEELSRAFEDARLDPDRLYRDCLLERARRRGGRRRPSRRIRAGRTPR